MKRQDITNAIKDEKWQEFRLSLKGLSTNDKLKGLSLYLLKGRTNIKEIQVNNYKNALKRGGLLK